MRRALACVLLFSGAVHAAGPFETFGVSPRSKGRANAVTATSRGWSAAFENPAGIARDDVADIGIATGLSLPQLSFEFDDDAQIARLPGAISGTSLGLSFGLGGFLEDRLFAGASVHSPVSVLTRAVAPDPVEPFFYRYDTYTDRLALSAGLSFRWFDFLRTGVGARIGAIQAGDVSLAIDPLLRRVTRQEINSAQLPSSALTAGVQVGPLGPPGIAEVELGFTYRGAVATLLEVNSELELAGLDIILDLPLSVVSNYTPETWAFGANVLVFDQVDLGVDVSWVRWSDAPTPYLNAALGIRGEGADDLGLTGELDAPGPGEERALPPGLIDTVDVRVGVTYRPFDDRLALRAGYAFRPTPVPDQTSGSNIVDNNAHILTGGLGTRASLPWLAKRPVRFDVSWQTHLLSGRRTEKRAGNPTGSYSSSGAVHEVSMGIGFEL